MQTCPVSWHRSISHEHISQWPVFFITVLFFYLLYRLFLYMILPCSCRHCDNVPYGSPGLEYVAHSVFASLLNRRLSRQSFCFWCHFPGLWLPLSAVSQLLLHTFFIFHCGQIPPESLRFFQSACSKTKTNVHRGSISIYSQSFDNVIFCGALFYLLYCLLITSTPLLVRYCHLIRWNTVHFVAYTVPSTTFNIDLFMHHMPLSVTP